MQAEIPVVPGAEFVNDDEFCMTCHAAYAQAFAHNVHAGDSCESCHGPASRHLETRGQEPGMLFDFRAATPAQQSEACISCHQEDQCSSGSQYRYSKHAQCGVSCIDCHSAHYGVPPGTPATTEPGGLATDAAGQPIILTAFRDYSGASSLGDTSNNLNAIAPNVCYKCHSDMREFQEIAGPHQIRGPNGFNCTTCHDPHGKIREESREELCLQCHGNEGVSMAWHSAIHKRHGVACTDCHNPHPSSNVPRVVNISRTDVRRPSRLPMSVDEPEACYKCHQEIYGLSAMPSRHPIREGRMVCSDCHDSHGRALDNLKKESVTQVCYRCHAEKEGPFVWEHPPVTEDCTICHNPHGSVANNLLHQPVTFLCLRCHNGHRKDNRNPDLYGVVQAGTYTDCTQCHAQIHGSDLPSNSRRRTFLR